jgi:hypothetical protein
VCCFWQAEIWMERIWILSYTHDWMLNMPIQKSSWKFIKAFHCPLSLLLIPCCILLPIDKGARTEDQALTSEARCRHRGIYSATKDFKLPYNALLLLVTCSYWPSICIRGSSQWWCLTLGWRWSHFSTKST